ncbi:MAG: ribosome maturation factor RimP [Candidatus Tokpelaia sp. JSC085]|nr:MAG: ribosome maturation factor RimP [Candidatus Tokpelaia sp. JSC085]
MRKKTTLLALIDEPRLIQESGVEAKVAAVIEPMIKSLFFRLVRVRLSRVHVNMLILQVLIERIDGPMSIKDCEVVSRMISPVLDVENLITCQYHLEISSPGIDRPLVRKTDFSNWCSHLVKLVTTVMISGRRKFLGRITAVDDDGFSIAMDTASTVGKALIVHIPFSHLAEAQLIQTDRPCRDRLNNMVGS